MDRGQARIRRQQRDHAIVATTRVSASVGGISVATGSPSQADFFKTGQVDRLHQDGPVDAGVLEEGCERSQADKLASIDGMRAEVKQLRAILVAADGGDAGGG